jgi:hypothetical protein
VSLSAALGAVPFSETAAAKSVSSVLAHRTIEAALAFVVGNTVGVVPTQVLAVAEGVLRTMFVAKLKLGVVLLFAASFGAFAASGPGVQPKASDIPIVDRVVVAVPADDDEPKAKPTIDLYGDPLPQGAIARLGSVRLKAHQIERFPAVYSINGDGAGHLAPSTRRTCNWSAGATYSEALRTPVRPDALSGSQYITSARSCQATKDRDARGRTTASCDIGAGSGLIADMALCAAGRP